MTRLEDELDKAYEIQTQKLGLSKDIQQGGKVLNRMAGWEIEADPRHAKLVVEQLGLANERGCVTPGVSGIEEEDDEGDVPLEGGGRHEVSRRHRLLKLHGRR